MTYHTLMLGYCDKGCRDKALKLYSKRPDEGFPSNEASYLKLMKGYIKKKTVDRLLLETYPPFFSKVLTSSACDKHR